MILYFEIGANDLNMTFIDEFIINNELTSTKSSSNINQNPHDLTIEISKSRNTYAIIYICSRCYEQSICRLHINRIYNTYSDLDSVLNHNESQRQLDRTYDLGSQHHQTKITVKMIY